jgi:hypothetical protein
VKSTIVDGFADDNYKAVEVVAAAAAVALDTAVASAAGAVADSELNVVVVAAAAVVRNCAASAVAVGEPGFAEAEADMPVGFAADWPPRRLKAF